MKDKPILEKTNTAQAWFESSVDHLPDREEKTLPRRTQWSGEFDIDFNDWLQIGISKGWVDSSPDSTPDQTQYTITRGAID